MSILTPGFWSLSEAALLQRTKLNNQIIEQFMMDLFAKILVHLQRKSELKMEFILFAKPL